MALSVPSSWEMLLFVVRLKVRTAVGALQKGLTKAVGEELRFGGAGAGPRVSVTQSGYKVRNFWRLDYSAGLVDKPR